MLGCDLDRFRQAPRIAKTDRDDRDLLVLAVWKTGILTNDKIRRLFGMTYSAVRAPGKSQQKKPPFFQATLPPSDQSRF